MTAGFIFKNKLMLDRGSFSEKASMGSWVPVAGVSGIVIHERAPGVMKVRAKSLVREPWSVAWAQNFDRNETVFDIGANVGVLSLFFGRHAKAYAFEPSRFAFEELLTNLKHNNSATTAVNAAVSDRSGSVPFSYASTNAEMAMNGVGSLPLGGKPALTEPVRAITVDDFEVKPDHIYIDTDGHECSVLRGAQNTLPRVNSMICEFLSEASYEASLVLLMKAGLKPLVKWQRLKGGKKPPWFQVFFARETNRWQSVVNARAKHSVAEVLYS